MDTSVVKLHSKPDLVLEALKKEFSSRVARNKNYSLRSFSKHLDVSPATLSKVFNEKLRPSKSLIKKMLFLMGDDLVAELEGSKEEKPRSRVSREIDTVEFGLISEWYYDVILELAGVNNFEWCSKSLAKSIGISVLQLKLAVDRLEKLGLVFFDKKGNLKAEKDTSFNTTLIDENTTSRASKKLQEQILLKSIEKLQELGVDKRSHTSVVLKFDENKIDEAKELIKKFRREFNKLMDTPEATNIYQLQVSLFPYLESSIPSKGEENDL